MMNTMNPAVILALIFSLVLPLGAMIWWKIKTGQKLIVFIVGAMSFLVFAMVLENILHTVCLVNDNAVSRAILASPVLYTLYAAFAAGIFEETGRLFCFKVLLRKHKENDCAVAYGIGHGGIEVLIIVGMGYLVLFLASLGMDFGSPEVNANMLATANSITIGIAAVAIFERICAMMIQAGLSMLVFAAARDKQKFRFYPIAILIHAMIDAPAALYQFGVIKSVLVVEAVACVMGFVCVFAGRRVLGEQKKEVSEQH